MRKVTRLCSTLLFTGLTFLFVMATPVTSYAETSVNAFIETEFAYGIDKPSWRKAETIIDLEIEGELTSDIGYTLIPRVRIDFDNNLSNYDSRPFNFSSWNGPLENDHYVVAELSEGYLNFGAGDSHWIIGKQQVVWGEADGIKVLDVINPQDLREINLDNFEDSRIPTWMINAEFYLPYFEESSLQVVLIPDMTFDLLPGNNTEFSRTRATTESSQNGGSETGNTDNTGSTGAAQTALPERPSGEWEVGLRWNVFVEGWDLSFIWFNHFHDLPVRFVNTDEESGQSVPVLAYQRNNLYGITASSAFGDWVIRSELAYQSNEFHRSSNLEQREIHQTSEFNTVIGFDYHGFEDMYASYQLFASYMDTYNEDVIPDRFFTQHTLLVRQDLWNDVLTLEGFLLFDQRDEDGEVRGKVIYQYDDHLTVWVGVDLFYGKSQGRFADFKDNDRLVFGFQYGL